MDGRVSFINIETSNDSELITGLLEMAGFSQSEVDALGELGVVGLLTFRDVERDDTASYTCTATNSLPRTTTLSTESDPIQLTVLGMSSVCLSVRTLFVCLFIGL